ncbi:hypothetical protein A5697_08055 [Mycobacterium sp. E3251]|uniref:rhodanese-like domain-containing protein n=1 Tax=Mycobacterium sp. E3251 TaxID=1834144 RepID=UPI0007FC7F11|nr:hypothetical protein A5697_08055 [Mycobacterium sp. E3251]
MSIVELAGLADVEDEDAPVVQRFAEIPPDREVWVHCASGYRASIAAALLDRERRDVVLIDDNYSNAEKLGITTHLARE